MKVLHLLVAGEIGGIEVLLKNYNQYSEHENVFLFLWSGGTIAEEMAAQNACVHIWDVRKNGYLRTLQCISRLCAQEHIDAVIAHHGAPFLKLVLLWVKWRNHNTAVIAYSHSTVEAINYKKHNLLKRLKIWLARWSQRLGFQYADGVIAISEWVKKSLFKNMGISPQKIHVVYNGTPIPDSRNMHREMSDTVRMIYVGRLEFVKGVHLVIRAVKEICGEFPVSLMIVGDGSYRSQLEELVRKEKLEEIVCFAGSQRNVVQFLSQADIFIHMPVWEEGFGITIIEAMAAGCVCVCADSGAISEIITDQVDGYIVRQRDELGLAEKLRQVIPMYRNGECGEISKNAQANVSKFSIEKYSRDLDDVITGVCHS